MTASATPTTESPQPITWAERKIIFGSSLGALVEWYDLYVYAALAATFAHLFFPAGNETAAMLGSLAVFGAAFLLRPIGALFFGRMGDRIGRKKTFVATIWLMGLATVGIGLLPTYQTIGVLAPVLLVVLRLAQGLALGGEVGGAATYLTEHAPPNRRGFVTSWLQTTATLGLLLSLVVVALVRGSMDRADFESWGWRVPFLLSIVLLWASVRIRHQLHESPVFQRMKAQGRLASKPIAESFSNPANLKSVLVLLFSAASGLGILYGIAQVYSGYFLTGVLKVDAETVAGLLAAALVAATPMYVFFGWLSDRIGRKWLMVGACLLAALTIHPVFRGLTHYGNPALEKFQLSTRVEVTGSDCTFRLFAAPVTSCDKARDFLARSGVEYHRGATAAAGSPVEVKVGERVVHGFDAAALRQALQAAGWTDKADPQQVNRPMLVLLLWWLIALLAMIFGPMVAFMVELFPPQLRYTSLSLPYHIGAGWFGGMLPFVLSSINVASGSVYAGLWYPIVICAMSFVVGALFIRETRFNSID